MADKQRMADDQKPHDGDPGGSARREAARIRQRREEQAASRSGLSGLLARLIGPSENERKQRAAQRNWEVGGEGEQQLAASLSKRCPTVAVLHDRTVPGSTANIDHIAVAASGVYVIDAKRYKGKITVENPLFGKQKLKIKGRDCTKLVHGLAKQVQVVQAALGDEARGVPVHGCLCFLRPKGMMSEVELPTVTTLKINGFPLYYSRRLTKRLNQSGPLSREQAEQIHARLARALPSA